jgi:hypothetical protein
MKTRSRLRVTGSNGSIDHSWRLACEISLPRKTACTTTPTESALIAANKSLPLDSPSIPQ